MGGEAVARWALMSEFDPAAGPTTGPSLSGDMWSFTAPSRPTMAQSSVASPAGGAAMLPIGVSGGERHTQHRPQDVPPGTGAPWHTRRHTLPGSSTGVRRKIGPEGAHARTHDDENGDECERAATMLPAWTCALDKVSGAGECGAAVGALDADVQSGVQSGVPPSPRPHLPVPAPTPHHASSSNSFPFDRAIGMVTCVSINVDGSTICDTQVDLLPQAVCVPAEIAANRDPATQTASHIALLTADSSIGDADVSASKPEGPATSETPACPRNPACTSLSGTPEKVGATPGKNPQNNEGVFKMQATDAVVLPMGARDDVGVGVLDDLSGTMVSAARKPAPSLTKGGAEGEKMMPMDVRTLPGSGTHTPDSIG